MPSGATADPTKTPKKPLPSFVPITHESVRVSEERYHRQKNRLKLEKQMLKGGLFYFLCRLNTLI